MNKVHGYRGVLLDVDLSSGQVLRRELPERDLRDYMGGRGLGMKLLWDALPRPGVDPLSPENPLSFMAGPFTGLPLPAAARTCVVTKSPITAPEHSRHPHASTISYSNMGGFFAPEIRFAGYDGIMVRGRAERPVYLYINNGEVQIRDARKFWGMGTDQFDRAFSEELGDPRFQTCCIGPAGENQVTFACIINTAARAAGRGGTGCVMGSKNLKAIAVRGSGQPDVAEHKRFLELLEAARQHLRDPKRVGDMRKFGTAYYLEFSNSLGFLATKNYREGTFDQVANISAKTSREKYWRRDFACFLCPMACKKSGAVKAGPHAGIVHDGPEYETGTMFGSNLLVGDLPAVLHSIYLADDFGLDAITAGNLLGFLMEARERKLIDQPFLDGVDLRWGNAEAVHAMLRKITRREGIGDDVSRGIRHLIQKVGQASSKFAIHCKGHGLAAWNCHGEAAMALCYATANRGACHLNGWTAAEQNNRALGDSTGVCMFVQEQSDSEAVPKILQAATGLPWTPDDYKLAGERIFNLEKCFNYREGFRRADDALPDRFFEEPHSAGPHQGKVLDRDKFESLKTAYYEERGWDPQTTQPREAKLKSLGLEFVQPLESA